MKKYFVFVVGCFALFPQVTSAMKINEIMYDIAGTDTGREWIEIYNDSDETVDFSNWKILENLVNHTVKFISGSETIPSKSYFIVADNSQTFLMDNPNFSGTLFDSVFSLTNTGESIALVDPSGNKIDEVVYSNSLGANGDGNTLQMQEGFLISAIPTPAAENSKQSSLPVSTSTTSISVSSSTINISSHSSPELIIKPKEKVDFELSGGRDRVASIKTPIKFAPEVSDDLENKSIKYMWNFGDGHYQKGKNVSYSYKYPGVYNVVLNALFDKNHAVSRFIVNILSPNIEFYESEEGLVFINLDTNEINIGGWKVFSEIDLIDFTFPQDTIISPKNQIIFDKELFVRGDKNIDFKNMKLNILFPNGDFLTKKSDIIKL